MCIICLAVDFMPYINTLKWIDNTSWWASVLGIVLVHYFDASSFGTTNRARVRAGAGLTAHVPDFKLYH